MKNTHLGLIGQRALLDPIIIIVVVIGGGWGGGGGGVRAATHK